MKTFEEAAKEVLGYCKGASIAERTKEDDQLAIERQIGFAADIDGSFVAEASEGIVVAVMKEFLDDPMEGARMLYLNGLTHGVAIGVMMEKQDDPPVSSLQSAEPCQCFTLPCQCLVRKHSPLSSPSQPHPAKTNRITGLFRKVFGL